ncbi:coiled-coil domain-containing protein 86-like [Montipora capricornis]|uniref:coiled-coil domain-containing protein 86-like n=1 Tax=Montipora capricornis TaxID=246305 RepID=UPI0035F13363
MAATAVENTGQKLKSIPRGRPKSGRVWKSEKQRKSAVIGVQPLHTSWKKKQQVRMEHKLMKVYERELKEEAKKTKEEKWKRIKERRKKKEDNEKKSEVVQVIKNTAKIKRMKKKQLRRIETR